MEFRNAYFEGKIVPYGEAKVGLATHALNYGTAVFGGLRGYWNEEQEQLFVFRPYDHFRRLLQSAKIMHMEIDQTPESLTKLTLDLLRTDGWSQDVYIRPLVYKSDQGIGVRLHDLHDELSIFALPHVAYMKNDANAHVTFSSWRRVDDNMIPARGKISGAYVNSALIKTEAAQAGFDEALVLTQDGHVSEGSAMNIFIVRDGVVITPPVSDNILEGITRRSVMEVLRNDMGKTIVERTIDRTEVFLAEELFMTGTAAQIVTVTRVDHRLVGKGVPGPVTTELRKLYEDIVRGRNPRYAHWNIPVMLGHPASA
jgi:branched-chain amino acid aminotransferase